MKLNPILIIGYITMMISATISLTLQTSYYVNAQSIQNQGIRYSTAGIPCEKLLPVEKIQSNTIGSGTNTKSPIRPPFIKSLGFENGTNSTGWEWGGADAVFSSSPSRLSTVDKNLVQSPDPQGKNALKVTVLSADCVHKGARAEVWLNNLTLHSPNYYPNANSYDFIPGDDTWFHWYVLFPKDLPVDSGWHIVTQFHGEAYQPNPPHLCHKNGLPIRCGLVPIGFNFKSNPSPTGGPNQDLQQQITGDFTSENNNPTLEFGVLDSSNSTDGYDRVWSSPLQLGHWYDILLHVKWEPCTQYGPNGECLANNGGIVQLWVDRSLVVDKKDRYTMATIYDDDKPDHIGTADPTFFRQGLYHCTTDSNGNNCLSQGHPIPQPQTIYYDGTVFAMCNNQDVFRPDTMNCEPGSPYP